VKSEREKGERRKEKGERRKEKGERRKEKGERRRNGFPYIACDGGDADAGPGIQLGWLMMIRLFHLLPKHQII